MKRLFAALFAVAFSTVGFAADMPVKAPYQAPAPVWSWTGFYAGIDGGYNLGKFSPFCGVCGVDGTTINLDDNSGFVGGNLTFLYQTNNLVVVGVEIGAQYWGFKSKAELVPTVAEVGSVLNLQSKIDWLAFAGAQLGLTPFDRTLVYLSGGVAWAHVKTEFGGAAIDLANLDTASTQSLTGWYIGGGLAFKITDGITFGGEYRHIDFGTVNATSGMLLPLAGSDKLTVDQAMARLKFKL